jgi:Flp pilus assembly protein CpaB
VKKKSPPFAIIGAAVLGIIVVILFVHWKNAQDAAANAKADQVRADMQAQIDALKAQTAAPTVTTTPTNMRMVYSDTQPVEAGQKISSAFFEKKLTPNDVLPEAYPEATDIVGFYAVRNIEKGDPLTPHNIAKTLPFMTARISPGMRALALPIFNADYNNTGGFAVDGDKVDLLYTTSTNNGFVIQTQMVMQNLDILYIPGPKLESDQVAGIVPAPPPGSPISITFQVTPEQAQALVIMSQVKNGKFSMILRARRDKDIVKIKPFVAADYVDNFQKVQRTTDKSLVRVEELRQKIEAAEKTQASQGTTNETPNPTPPSP